MSLALRPAPSWERRLVVVATAALAGLLVALQVLMTQMLREPRVSLDAYMDGAAHRPFAYRVLTPLALRAIDAASPPALDAVFDGWGRSLAYAKMTHTGDPNLDRKAIIRSGPTDEHPRAIIWLIGLQWLCLMGYALVGADLFRRLFPRSRWGGAIAPILLGLLVPIVQRGFGHVYDFGVLLATTSLLWAMVRRKDGLYLALFALACLNKETAVFSAIAYAAVFFGRLPRARYIGMLAAQGVIFLTIYGAVRLAFAHNGGGATEVWIGHQLAWYQARPLDAVMLGVVALAMAWRWSDKPELMRRAAVVLIPHLILFFYAAAPGEFRDLYESAPLISLFLIRNLELLASPRPALVAHAT